MRETQLMETVVFRALGAAVGIFLIIPLATAGQVYGTVKKGNGPARNTTVKVFCPDADPLSQSIGTTKTDKYGSYSIYIDFVGICAIKVGNKDKVSVPLYDDEVRYDLRIVGNRLERD